MSRQLISFLVKEHQIPYRLVGRSNVLDDVGYRQLVASIEEHRSRADSLIDLIFAETCRTECPNLN